MHQCYKHGARLSHLIGQDAVKLGYDSLLVSGGVDTSFVALSVKNSLGENAPIIAFTVALSPDSRDLYYSRLLCNKLGLRHEVILYPGEREVLECEEIVLRTLKTIDPIEAACDIPACIGIRRSVEAGFDNIATGDGGDELFLGYDFLLDRSKEELDLWISRVLEKTRFSSEIIGEALGARVTAALFTEPVKDYSLRIPLDCKIGSYEGRRWGKLLLRLFLDRNGLGEIAWREKTPILYGSGADKLIERWSLEARKTYSREEANRTGIRFPSYPHYYLYRRLLELGIELPPECDEPSRKCVVCGRRMESGFCRFCGSSKTSSGLVSHYSDELWEASKP
jgi:asparagine synthase (glutamine-hydrolysing)